ncbi:hypothetical protein V6N11_002434 [Hibiscus sabdariffa]|uniref:Transmembrane 9 superfamily member n=1 Tax=Hibiscus sabdariffa TaxID=183260 RepID=A0ABR2SAY4_9ROSI
MVALRLHLFQFLSLWEFGVVLENKVVETLCHKKLERDDVAKFRDAVINDFYFQMYYDDLPFWGFVGKIEDYSWTLEDKSPKYFLFKHVEFEVLYNGNNVIEVHAIGDPNRVVDITEDVGISAKYVLVLCCHGRGYSTANLIVLVCLGILYPYNRGTLCTALVILYSLTSVVAGYTTASIHCQFAETGWERSVLLAGIMHAGPLFVIGFILNVIAVSYEAAAAALPFSSMLVIILIYTFLAIPLLVLGGVIGYLFRSEFKSPCATKRYLREIPPLAWMLTLPSILFIMFIILILLTAILSVGLTYIQLSVEDHQWWWRSVLCGGSTSIFMFDYCIYFYARSSMSGLLQFSFVVGYNACMCYAFFLMLGTVGFRSSLIFVRYIYELLRVNDSASSCSR